MQYGPSGSGGGFDSPPVHCRSAGLSVEFEHVSSEFGARARSFPRPIFPKICHNFGTFTPSPIFSKICRNFGTFTPSLIFPKICQSFGTFTPSLIFPKIATVLDFSRIQTLGTFVLRFRYFEFTACVYRSFEFTIRFKTCISDCGGCGTTLPGAASTKTSVMPTIFQACWSWVRVSFWHR